METKQIENTWTVSVSLNEEEIHDLAYAVAHGQISKEVINLAECAVGILWGSVAAKKVDESQLVEHVKNDESVSVSDRDAEIEKGVLEFLEGVEYATKTDISKALRSPRELATSRKFMDKLVAAKRVKRLSGKDLGIKKGIYYALRV
jgi:hypothetical protein